MGVLCIFYFLKFFGVIEWPLIPDEDNSQDKVLQFYKKQII